MAKTGGCAALLLSLAAPQALPAGTDAGVERMKTLKAQIDSLELEKQAQKRSGQELSDLEEQTALLRDSIAALKTELEKRPAGGAQSVEQAVKNSFLPQSIGLFDWILIGSAGLVIVLALIFILIYRLGASGRGRTPRQGRPPAKQWEPQDSVGKPRDTAVRRAYTAQMGGGAQPAPPAARPPDAPPKPKPAVPSGPAAQPGPVTADLPKDQSDLVVRAAASGLDVKEISRRYHISEDQVALIIKMSKKQ